MKNKENCQQSLDTEYPEGQGTPEVTNQNGSQFDSALNSALEQELCLGLPLDDVPVDSRSDVKKILASLKIETLNGKPVLYYHGISVLTLNSEEFHAKLLCDGPVFNLGLACGFSCVYCYVEAVILKLVHNLIARFNREHEGALGRKLSFSEIAIRRKDAVNILRTQLIRADGTPIYNDPADNRVVYTSTLVDPASSMTLLRETADACNLILENTHWQIRILSKSFLLMCLIKNKLIAEKYHHRLILGFSIGTLDDDVAEAIEQGTSKPSKRLEALHWLQDHGIRTFGMICPSLPQENYDTFSKSICDATRVEKCEHVWGEVINVRGETYLKTRDALLKAGLADEAKRFDAVFGPDAEENDWEQYARATFLAHTQNVPSGKLRFLQYVNKQTVDWWAEQRPLGAVPIGKVAKRHSVLAAGESAPQRPVEDLTDEDRGYLAERELKLSEGVQATITAAAALHEIHSYKDGALWKKEHHSFEAYCQSKWGYGKAHAYRLLGAGRFVSEIASSNATLPIAESSVELPKNEAQIRPILSIIPEDHQLACWSHITEKNPPASLTQAKVEMLVKDYAKAMKFPSKEKPSAKIKPDEVARAHRVLQRLREVLEKVPMPGRFDPLLAGIEITLDQPVSETQIGMDDSVLPPRESELTADC